MDLHCILWEFLLAGSNTEVEASVASGMCAHLKSCGVHLEAPEAIEWDSHDLMG